MTGDETTRDVQAPVEAVAWAAGTGALPGRWLYDEQDVARAERAREVVLRTEIDPDTGRPWLRDIGGRASLADVAYLTTELAFLRSALLTIVEDASDVLMARGP